jgi:hypothetical protein
MKRREFNGLVAGLAAAWPFAARGQQPQKRIAFVHSGIPADQLTEIAGLYWVRRFYETLRALAATIPIVAISGDLIALGLLARLARWGQTGRDPVLSAWQIPADYQSQNGEGAGPDHAIGPARGRR